MLKAQYYGCFGEESTLQQKAAPGLEAAMQKMQNYLVAICQGYTSPKSGSFDGGAADPDYAFLPLEIPVVKLDNSNHKLQLP